MTGLLFIWVEGGSDARFFEAVLKPLFRQFYRRVEIRAYANLKRVKFQQILQGIEAMEGDYIVVADIDEEPCVTAKKFYVRQRIHSLDDARIRVVIREIESWYLAGLDRQSADNLSLPDLEKTDNVTKEMFAALMPEKFTSRIDFMMEILKLYSLETAMQKNDSIRYFVHKHRLAPTGQQTAERSNL